MVATIINITQSCLNMAMSSFTRNLSLTFTSVIYFIVIFTKFSSIIFSLVISLCSHYAFMMCVHYFLLMCAFTFLSLTHFHKYNFDKLKFMLEDHHKSSSTPMTTPLALWIKYSQKIVANVCKHKFNLWLASTYFFYKFLWHIFCKNKSSSSLHKSSGHGVVHCMELFFCKWDTFITILAMMNKNKGKWW